MCKNLFVLIFSLLVFLFSGCATAGIEVSSLKDLPAEVNMNNLPSADTYPGADGVVLYENTVYDVDYVPRVGMETYKTFHKIYRVFNNEDNFMENLLDFDERTTFQSFSARTIKPDGTIVDLTQDDLYQLVFTRTNKDFKGDMYAAVYNFPALKKGDIIEVKYKAISRYFYFSDVYYVQSNLPKLYSRFEIRIPNFIFDAEFEFTYKLKNISIKEPSYTKGIGDSGDRSYVWENRNIPEFKPEPMMGDDMNYRGYVEMQLAYWNTWNGLARDHYDRNYKPVIDDMSRKDKEKIRSKVAGLVAGAEDTLEKIKRITNFVQTFRYSSTAVYFGHGVKPNEIGLILEREYGDCKDHAVMLVAMLKEIGVVSWPALVAAYDPSGIDPKFVTEIFNHVMVKTVLDGGQVLWLDPTSRFTQFGKLPEMDEDTYVLELRPKNVDKEYKIKLEKTPASVYSDNIVEKHVKGVIKNGIPEYDVTLKFSGHKADAARFDYEFLNAEKIEKNIRCKLRFYLYDASISDIRMENLYDTEKPFVLKYSVKLKENVDDGLPVVPFQFFDDPVFPNDVYLEKRTKPVVLPSVYSTIETYEMNFDPEKYAVSFPEELENIEFSEGDVNSWKVAVKNSSGKISFTAGFAQKGKKVETEKIPSLLKKVVDFTDVRRKMYRVSIIPVSKEIPAVETENKDENKTGNTSEKAGEK